VSYHVGDRLAEKAPERLRGAERRRRGRADAVRGCRSRREGGRWRCRGGVAVVVALPRRQRCRGAGFAEETLPGGGDDVGDEVVLDKDEGVGGKTSGGGGRAGYVRRHGGGIPSGR
jgi:hypothetical protein